MTLGRETVDETIHETILTMTRVEAEAIAVVDGFPGRYCFRRFDNNPDTSSNARMVL